jgi:GntR family transcriptional regulator
MDLKLDPSSSVPLYAQVISRIRSLVASRALRAGDQLPSIRDLAASLRINRNTAAKAYEALEADGVIEMRQGHGCFVTGRGVAAWSKEERMRRLEKAIDQALVEAYHLGVPFEEIPALVRRRVERFRKEESA